MKQREIASIQELVQALEEDVAEYGGAQWYRGQANKNWSLLPGYYRLKDAPSESTLVKRFKQSAALLTSANPKDTFDWLFLMQHYGVPTRLLDWSENPLVALYFAVGNAQSKDDAALWVLRPTELNKKAGIIDADEQYFIPSFDDEDLKNYSVETLLRNKRNMLKPVAAIATRNNARIQAQHGVFTIHHNEIVPIEGIDNASHVFRYNIAREVCSLLSKQLKILGFTKFQLFPELGSIGDIIKEDL